MKRKRLTIIGCICFLAAGGMLASAQNATASLGHIADGKIGSEMATTIPREANDKRFESLFLAVDGLTKAYDERDIRKITEWFNSEDVARIGGFETFADLVGQAGSAAHNTSVKFGSPDKMDLVNGKWFAVVSFRMETRKKELLKVAETCLVAISTDDGVSWRFKTGESFFEDYNELVGTIPVIERRVTETSIEQ